VCDVKARVPLLIAVALAAATACTASTSSASSPTTFSPSLSPPTTTAAQPDEPSTVTSSTSTTTAPPQSASDVLAALRIDDRPHRDGYRREGWPLWKDIDGDGCDARDQALMAASTAPARVNGVCDVASGSWRSAYDGMTTTNPSELDIDHVVPLENAYQSGGWQWETDRRAQYANDQADLWVVSASSNRSKGAMAPDEWRPPARGVWCEYATRWVAIKIRWDLTATTAERDALGQMLDTCTTSPEPSSLPASTVPALPTATTPPPAPAPTEPADPSTVYYANCAAVRAAGKAPLHRGDPGYRPALDRDSDGIACE
jgi:hypothetical protein